ncbi:MAG: GIY-YIG nuclease family protein [Kiritimatiellae bacterium]|nr:GIY-YIG nuclease family protein [Kiritimatiellia bacterium]
MSDIDRKQLIREYKETPRPAGVYRVHNTVRGKTFIGSSTNLPGILNRHRFQLEHGSHMDHDLQRDWNELGPEAFEFEVLDTLAPKKELDYDPTEDLAVLLDLWTDKIAATGELLYGRKRPHKRKSIP